MEVTKEITVFLENEPGTLAEVTSALAERNVNILGFDLSNALDYGALRLIVDDPETAIHLLGEHNMFVLEHDVLIIGLRNEAGALTRLSRALADAGINLEYAYGSAGAQKGPTMTLFARVADTARAVETLSTVDGVD
jgi:hypothetical protein